MTLKLQLEHDVVLAGTCDYGLAQQSTFGALFPNERSPKE